MITTVVLALAVMLACAGQREISRFEIDYLISDANRLVVLDDVDSAAIVINEAARQAPRDTAVLRQQGIINRKLGTVEGRRKSAAALRQLVEADRRNPDYRVELARTLIAQTFDLEARYHLSLAIDLDSTLEEAYLMLGNSYRQPYFEDGWAPDADSAQEVLSILTRKVPESIRGLVMLAELLVIRGETDSAAALAEKAVELDSNVAEANLVAGYSCYRQQRFARAKLFFERAISQLDTFATTPYTYIRNLLRPQDQAEYDRLSPTARDSFAVIYWRSVDFDPTTEINERQIEHWARVWKANLLFSNQRYEHEGWLTDMGTTMIRLGDPDERERGSIHSGHTSGTPAWYWRYQTTALPCTLVFVDQMLSGTYNFPFPGSDHTGSLRLNASKEIAYLNSRIRPQESQVIRSRARIPFEAKAYRFLDEAGQAQLLIAAEYAPTAMGDTAPGLDELRIRASTQDGGFKILQTFEAAGGQVMQPAVGGDPEASALTYLACLELPARSGYLGWNVVLEARDKSAFGRVSDTIRFQKDVTDSLVLSDIMLSSGIERAEGGGAVGFRRGDLVVVPHLNDTASLAEPLLIYFEIANLPIDIRSVTRYEMTYQLSYVKSAAGGLKGLLGELWPGRRESVSNTYREGGKETRQRRQLALDVSELRPGHYELTIEINDLIFGKRATRTTNLTLLP